MAEKDRYLKLSRDILTCFNGPDRKRELCEAGVVLGQGWSE